MARVYYGDIITNIRGSIGGVTFQQNTSGKIAKLKAASRRPASQLQALAINPSRRLVNKWHNLSLENQDLWKAFASTYDMIDRNGNYKTVTGYNWFVSANFWRERSGAEIQVTPPTYALPSVPSSFTFAVDESTAVITLDVADTDPTTRFQIFANQISNQSNPNVVAGFRFLRNWQGSNKTAIDIAASYETAFGQSLLSGSWSQYARLCIYLRPIGLSTGIMRGKVQQLFQLG